MDIFIRNIYELEYSEKQNSKKVRILIRSGTKLEDFLRLNIGAAEQGFEPQ